MHQPAIEKIERRMKNIDSDTKKGLGTEEYGSLLAQISMEEGLCMSGDNWKIRVLHPSSDAFVEIEQQLLNDPSIKDHYRISERATGRVNSEGKVVPYVSREFTNADGHFYVKQNADDTANLVTIGSHGTQFFTANVTQIIARIAQQNEWGLHFPAYQSVCLWAGVFCNPTEKPPRKAKK